MKKSFKNEEESNLQLIMAIAMSGSCNYGTALNGLSATLVRDNDSLSLGKFHNLDEV